MPGPITADALVACGATPADAEDLAGAIRAWHLPPEACWQRLARERLSPRIPFAVHLYLYEALGRGPAWIPTEEEIARSRISASMRERGFASYDDLWRWSVADKGAFWAHVLERLGIPFATPPEQILDTSEGAERARWLPGARLNIVASCFRAPPETTAIVYTEADSGAIRSMSYGALAEEVAGVAALLPALGLSPGDAVAVFLPMTPAAVAIYLGVVAAGMRVVAIADSLAPPEIATRLRIGGARLVFTSAAEQRGRRVPLYQQLLEADPPRAVVLGGPPLRPGDVAFAPPRAGRLAPVIAEAGAITGVLFSSGTTGEPKAIPWTHLTPIKAAADAAFHFDVRPGDVVAWPSGLGWMMGPWLVFAALINGATMALFGGAPTLRAFGEFVAAARVTVLGVVPTLVRSWRALDRMRGLDWSAIRCFGSTGEVSNPEDMLHLMMLAGYPPVIEYCGGTEIGGAFVTGTLVQPCWPATFTTPALGSELVILDEAGRPAERGELFLVPPALGSSQTLLNGDHHRAYHEGTPLGPAGIPLRRHGDEMQRLPGGRFRALGRADDAMNLGGVKVSAAEIERVLDLVPGVLRTAAIADAPEGGGPSRLVIYAVPSGSVLHATLLARLQEALTSQLNALFRISELVLVDALPVTASNKVMRRELRRRRG
jgi:acetyl-CoA synthetase